jgi:hypothetical protein
MLFDHATHSTMLTQGNAFGVSPWEKTRYS